MLSSWRHLPIDTVARMSLHLSSQPTAAAPHHRAAEGSAAHDSAAASRRPLMAHQLVFGLLFAVALVGLAWLAWRGWSYYTTPLIERPRHPDYWLLKPGGTWGRLYGMVGASLLVAMLVYSVRKRLRWLRNAGSLRVWLAFHIFCGVVGSLLILLHTSFKFGGIVSISFWSMVVVALSGVLGRYLYRQIPRARTGDELSLRQAEEENAALGRWLLDLGVPDAALERLDEIARAGPSETTGLLGLLLRLPFDSLRLRWRLRSFRRGLRGVPPRLRRRASRLAGRKARLARRIALWTRLQRLFYYWHVLHKPFAFLMYLFLIVHVAVVTMAGYGFG